MFADDTNLTMVSDSYLSLQTEKIVKLKKIIIGWSQINFL